jgi:hypothetical protein
VLCGCGQSGTGCAALAAGGGLEDSRELRWSRKGGRKGGETANTAVNTRCDIAGAALHLEQQACSNCMCLADDQGIRDHTQSPNTVHWLGRTQLAQRALGICLWKNTQRGVRLIVANVDVALILLAW